MNPKRAVHRSAFLCGQTRCPELGNYLLFIFAMTELIVLPLGALILAIVAVRLMRGIRRVSELQMQREPLRFSAEHRRPSDEFHYETWLPMCTRVAELAAQRLGRELTERERRRIWRSRSVLVLEVALKEIEGTSMDAVAELLANLPSGVDRPDSKGWCVRG